MLTFWMKKEGEEGNGETLRDTKSSTLVLREGCAILLATTESFLFSLLTDPSSAAEPSSGPASRSLSQASSVSAKDRNELGKESDYCRLSASESMD